MITCDCSCVYDGSADDFVTEKTVTARKQHRCGECGDTIQKGEKYQKADGCWDHSWQHYKTCKFCVKLRDQYCPGGYIYGELAESIYECMGFWYPSDPSTWEDEPREPEAWQLRELDKQKHPEKYGTQLW